MIKKEWINTKYFCWFEQKNFDTIFLVFSSLVQVSYADYNLFDLCNVHEILSPGCLNEFKCLKAWHTKFAARPKIAAYQQSEAFKSRGINGNPNK